MKIEYRIGDLLDAPGKVVIQGCNAQGIMGSGLARYIMDRHPKVQKVYRKTYEAQGDHLELGQVIPVALEGDLLVINAITQEFYGKNPDILYASYSAIRTAVRSIDMVMRDTDFGEGDLPEVAFPLIGAGLANGDWSIIEGIIEDESHSFKPVVYILQDDLRKFLRKRV